VVSCGSVVFLSQIRSYHAWYTSCLVLMGFSFVVLKMQSACRMQIDTGIQEIWCNVLHHPIEKVPKMNSFWPSLWRSAGLQAHR